MNAGKKFKIAGLLSLCLLFSGCAIFLLGSGVAGGIAISKDTIEGNWDKSLDKVWRESREVLMQEGFIRLENRVGGKIEAEVRKSMVEVEILQISARTVRIHVKARKGHKLLPDIDLANGIYNKIFERVK